MHRPRWFLAVAALACGPLAVQAVGRDFTVVNRTGYPIDRIYVSQSSERQWGADAMRLAKLDNGAQASLSLPTCEGRCQWDLRVEYHDGERATWSGLDLGALSRIALVWNTRTRRTTAQPD